MSSPRLIGATAALIARRENGMEGVRVEQQLLREHHSEKKALEVWRQSGRWRLPLPGARIEHFWPTGESDVQYLREGEGGREKMRTQGIATSGRFLL